MKILIHNYSSETSTEPMLLAQAFKDIGYQVVIWGHSISAYDMFDTVDPDLFICRATLLNKEMVKRLSESPHCKVVVNCEGLVKDQLPVLDGIIRSDFKYSNTGTLPIHSLTVFDPFLIKNKQKTPNYEGKCLSLVGTKPENRFIRDRLSHIVSYSSSYEDADIYVPIHYLGNLYHRYEEVGVDVVSQLAYDAAYYNGSCYVFDTKTTITKESIKGNTPYDLAMDILNGIGNEEGASKMAGAKNVFLSKSI